MSVGKDLKHRCQNSIEPAFRSEKKKYIFINQYTMGA